MARIWAESTISSLYVNVRVSENPHSGKFYAVKIAETIIEFPRKI